MSLNLLTFLVPAANIGSSVYSLAPSSYQKFTKWSTCDHAETIRNIVGRILNKEIAPGAPYHESLINSIQEGLPQSVQPKTIQTFLDTRLRIVLFPPGHHASNAISPMMTRGSDWDIGKEPGTFVIALPADLEEAAVPWFAARECCHLLNDAHLETKVYTAIASLAAAIFSTFVLGWTLLPSLGLTLLAQSIAHIVSSQREEKRADAFANLHCTDEEKKHAIALLQTREQFRSAGSFPVLDSLFKFLTYSLERERAAMIRGTITWATKAQGVLQN